MSCTLCESGKKAEFNAEMNIHFPGLKRALTLHFNDNALITHPGG